MKAHWWQCRDAGPVGWGPTESLRRSRGRTRVDEGGARRGGADQIGCDASWRPIACGSGLAGLAGGLAAAVLWVAASLHVTRRASGPRQAVARVRLRPERGSACELLRFIAVAARGPGVDTGSMRGRRWGSTGGRARAECEGKSEGGAKEPRRGQEGARQAQGRSKEGAWKAQRAIWDPCSHRTQQPRRRTFVPITHLHAQRYFDCSYIVQDKPRPASAGADLTWHDTTRHDTIALHHGLIPTSALFPRQAPSEPHLPRDPIDVARSRLRQHSD
jgi:hypothetical protein